MKKTRTPQSANPNKTMNMTQTTTDAAALIRRTLRNDYGWSSRKVSVRADYFSMGSSIDVTIKDPAVDYRVVEAVAENCDAIVKATKGAIYMFNVSVRYSPGVASSM